MKRIVLTFIWVCVIVGAYALGKEKNVNIVYIGNSITQGVLLNNPGENAPPVQASQWLGNQPGIGHVEFSNQGVSGKTTLDFLPASETFFPKVKDAADRFKGIRGTTLIFSMMLGTNDSAIKGPNGAPVLPKQYYTNMKAIIDELLTLYPNCKIVLQRPIWYSPNTYNGAMYLLEGLHRLEKYLPELEALTTHYAQSHPRQVFMGDTSAFDYFKSHYQTELVPENGLAGTFYLHPNQEGAKHLGEFWGKAIYRVVESL